MARAVGGRYVDWLLIGVLLSRMLTLFILRDRRGMVMMLSRSAIGMLVLVLMIAWGVCYYLLMSVVEIIAGWKLPDWKEEDVDRSWNLLSGKA